MFIKVIKLVSNATKHEYKQLYVGGGRGKMDQSMLGMRRITELAVNQPDVYYPVRKKH